MKLLIVCCLVALAAARPQFVDRVQATPVPIVRSAAEQNYDGSYEFSFEAGNGITREERGHVENLGTENEVQVIQGFYSYPGPDGQLYTIRFVANENGFQPEGAHLPVAPPVPEVIARAVQRSLAAEAERLRRA